MRKIDGTTIIFSVLSAILAYFVGEVLITFAYGKIPDEALMGLYFGIIGIIIVSVMCFCVYKISKLKYEIPANNIFFKSLQILIILTFSVLLVLGAGFEFLYSLNLNGVSFGTNYIIAVDNSGSMEGNDPNYERFNALNELFSSVKNNQKIGVYVFNTESTNVIPLQKIDKSKLNEYKSMLEKYKVSDGGTNLMNTLEDIMNYIEKENVKNNTDVIVISDGECSINNNVLNKFVNKRIPIHTIGVVDTYNSLHNISIQTRGNYYDIGHIEELGSTLNTIYNLQTGHFLVGRRSGLEADMLRYIIMRVVFIFILSIIIKIMELFIIDIVALRKFITVQCVLFSMLSAICIEFIMQNINIDESLVRFLMILFISLLFATHIIKRKNDIERLELDFNLIDNKNMDNKKDENRKSLK